MTDLLPCPFCGGQAEMSSYESCDCCGKAYNGSVSCLICSAEVSHLDTDAEAIAAWNKRSGSVAQGKQDRDKLAAMLKTNGFTSRDGTYLQGGTYRIIDAILSALSSTDREAGK